MFFCVNNREQGGPFSFLCSFATPSFIKPLVSLKAGILLLPKLSSECFILQFMELRKYDQFNTIPKIQKHHHLAVLLCYKCSYFISFFDACPVVVKAPPTLQELNDPEESGCMAKNAFQEVPYSQCREEVVHSRPEVAYKRLLGGLRQDASQIHLGRVGTGSGLSTAGCQSEQEKAGVQLPKMSKWNVYVFVCEREFVSVCSYGSHLNVFI